MSELQNLKSKVYVEPSTDANRPYIIDLIKLRVADAKTLSEDELLHGEGSVIAADICGAIAWNSADEGVEHDNWLNNQSEPTLYEIMDISGKLDADASDKDSWQQLFSVSDTLR